MRRRGLVACDTGPLVALHEPADQNHAACLRAAEEIRAPLITVWPVITEALYLLRQRSSAAPLLLEQIEAGNLLIVGPRLEDLPRIRRLMQQYADVPMDFADAALLALCEREGIATLFTTDRHDFTIYRPAHVRRMRLVP